MVSVSGSVKYDSPSDPTVKASARLDGAKVKECQEQSPLEGGPPIWGDCNRDWSVSEFGRQVFICPQIKSR